MANVTSVKVDGVNYPCEDTWARNKLSTAVYEDDIIDNLNSGDIDKPLSARQGKELNNTKLAKAAISISGTALVITTT